MLARKVLLDITNEEKEHVGEFARLLRELAPEDEEFYREGIEETEEAIAEVTDEVEHCCHGGGGCGTVPCDSKPQSEQKTCACEGSRETC